MKGTEPHLAAMYFIFQYLKKKKKKLVSDLLYYYQKNASFKNFFSKAYW